jgi:hypothetical protein
VIRLWFWLLLALTVQEPGRKTYTAEEVATLLGTSAWSIYAAARTGEGVIGAMAITVGRRIVWPRAGIDRLLGIDQSTPAETSGAASISILPAHQDGDGQRVAR